MKDEVKQWKWFQSDAQYFLPEKKKREKKRKRKINIEEDHNHPLESHEIPLRL